MKFCLGQRMSDPRWLNAGMKTTIVCPSTPAAANPDHHIWNNNGTWWCHFTVHKSDYTAERVRVSLRTRSREVARQRRDLLLAAVPSIAAWLPSVFSPEGPAGRASLYADHGVNL
jgi:hypothetical protein